MMSSTARLGAFILAAELNKNAVAKLPRGAPVKQFVLNGKELFDKPDTAKLRKEKMLNEVGA